MIFFIYMKFCIHPTTMHTRLKNVLKSQRIIFFFAHQEVDSAAVLLKDTENTAHDDIASRDFFLHSAIRAIYSAIQTRTLRFSSIYMKSQRRDNESGKKAKK